MVDEEQILSELDYQIQTFRDHILEAGVLDPEGVHHELKGGMHGQKLDFDTIPTNSPGGSTLSPLYDEWVQVNVDFVRSEFNNVEDLVFLGVANGTNRLAGHIAKRISQHYLGVESAKDTQDPRRFRLTGFAKHLIAAVSPELVIVPEDVGTTGSSSAQVATLAQEAGAKNVIVVNTWQRREHLERLDKAGIEYRAIIDEPLPTYSVEDCIKTGLCSQGWELIPRKP